jgi:hypothetical protein
MTALTFEGQLGADVDLDLCWACQAIWFDHLEDVRLSRTGTLNLFRAMGERTQMSPSAVREPLKCPRCGSHLRLTHDRQRNTPFRYWRCPHDEGRLITFVDFLREKDFVRPVSPQQLAELRQTIRTINCSNCGAPIDLVHDTVCQHCGSPISILDVKQIQQLADPGGAAGVTAAAPAATPADGPDIAALFDALRTTDERTTPIPSWFGLVEAGLRLVARWLS